MKFDHTNLPIELDLPKLIRDNIPQIIKDTEGVQPKVHVAKNDAEFKKFLLKKVIEEAVEVFNAKDKDELTKELADLVELINTIKSLEGIKDEELEYVRILKRNKNGGFDKRIIFEGK